MGPSVGSSVMGVITAKATGALVLYSTGAQQEPSGKGSMEATLTTSGPVVAFDGTFTSIRVSRHCTTSAATPLICTSLTPNGISGSFMPMLGPKLRPIICTVVPGAASLGETSLTVGTSTVKVPTVLVFVPDLTTTGPVTALRGTLTTIRSFSHCSTSPRALFLPKSTALFLADTNFPNPSPVMVTVTPIGPESGLIAKAAHAGPPATMLTARVAESKDVFISEAFSFQSIRSSREVPHYNTARLETVKARGRA